MFLWLSAIEAVFLAIHRSLNPSYSKQHLKVRISQDLNDLGTGYIVFELNNLLSRVNITGTNTYDFFVISQFGIFTVKIEPNSVDPLCILSVFTENPIKGAKPTAELTLTPEKLSEVILSYRKLILSRQEVTDIVNILDQMYTGPVTV